MRHNFSKPYNSHVKASGRSPDIDGGSPLNESQPRGRSEREYARGLHQMKRGGTTPPLRFTLTEGIVA
jgi:hypothetical protein